MNFLHPEFLWLAPLLAVPILIHLLNRVRYRRMKWAAIEFLLQTERRAVRRARLRQILLMILRTMVLAMALGAITQPIFSGGIGSLLGGSGQVAVALDASASMSAQDAGGPAFDRARQAAVAEVKALARSSRVTAGIFTTRWDSPYRDPVQDHEAVTAYLESTQATGGGTDVPQAILGAAESLARGGGGGTLWLITDMRATGWHAGQTGAWDEVRKALDKAGRPRLIVSDMGPTVAANFSVSKIHLVPEVLMEKDVPRLTATIRLEGSGGGLRKLQLFFEGTAVDAGQVDLKESGTADVIFHLPALKATPQAGYLELERDAVPGDDRHYFVLRPTTSVPVLVVSGVMSALSFDGSGDFVAAALQPPATETGARSPFSIKSVAAKDLGGLALADYAAIILTDVPRLEPEIVKALQEYVAAGNLLIIFPGAHTDLAAWNDAGLAPVKFESVVQKEGDKRLKVAGVSPNDPLTATLPTEGLDRVLVGQYIKMTPSAGAEVLASLEGGAPLLVRAQRGKGKICTFAVSAQTDFSNLPFTPVFLLTMHRALLGHMGEVRAATSQPTMTTLEFPSADASGRIVTPDGRPMLLARRDDRPDKAFFEQTSAAGIYRFSKTDGAEAIKSAGPVAAMNVPPEESAMAKITPAEARALLGDSSVYFLQTDGNLSQVGAESGTTTAISGFPLAVLAILLIVAEVLVAWSMGRPPASAKKTSATQSGEGLKAA